MSSDDGFSLHVTVFIEPENVLKLLEALESVYDMVTEEEENCTVFEVYQSFENPGEIRLVQTWNNDIYWMKAVRAYPPPRPKPLGLSGNDRSYNFMTKCYHKTYFAATEALHSKPREFKIFNRPAMEYKYSAGAH